MASLRYFLPKNEEKTLVIRLMRLEISIFRKRSGSAKDYTAWFGNIGILE